MTPVVGEVAVSQQSRLHLRGSSSNPFHSILQSSLSATWPSRFFVSLAPQLALLPLDFTVSYSRCVQLTEANSIRFRQRLDRPFQRGSAPCLTSKPTLCRTLRCVHDILADDNRLRAAADSGLWKHSSTAPIESMTTLGSIRLHSPLLGPFQGQDPFKLGQKCQQLGPDHGLVEVSAASARGW
jgi:hypothetical protein